MSAVDEEFYGTLERMEALTREALLCDTAPLVSNHNTAARILRLGLAVTAFSLLERYVTERFSELMTCASGCAVAYSTFPTDLKQFIVLHAVTGLVTRAKHMEKVDAVAFAEASVAQISAHASSPASYTALGFSPKGSNVGESDIAAAFGALGVASVWSTLTAITHEIGGGRVSLAQDYKTLARTRNKSAHNPIHNVPTSDLVSHIEIARIIGIAVSVLAGCVERAYASATTARQLSNVISTVTRTYRFLDEELSGAWVERTTTAGRISKRYPNRAAAIADARVQPGDRFIILRNNRLVPIGLG